MKKTLIFIASVCLLTSTACFAKKQFVLIGGGGEPTDAKDQYGNPILGTMFDDDILDVRAFLDKATQWEKDVSFNGGHPDTEAILKQNFQDVQTTSFTSQQYKKMINEYEKKLQLGFFSSGDQILIQIATHGAINGQNQLTHSVATANNAVKNYDTLNGDLADLDDLKRITQLAKAKGVKVAIIDESCHSGNSLALADENTCVLSSTGPVHYGWNGGNSNPDVLNKTLAPGKSLEDIFLKARRDSSDSGFPMISGPIGKKVQDLLYPLLTPYLYNFDENHDKLLPYMTSGDQDMLCRYDNNFQELNDIIAQVQDINKNIPTKTRYDLEALKASLKEYYDFQRSIIESLQGIDFSLLKKQEDIVARENYYTLTYKFTWRELMTMDYDKRIAEFQDRIAKSTNKNDQFSLQLNIKALQNAKARGEQLRIQYPNLVNVDAKLNSIVNKESRSYQMATRIGKQSRALYDVLYNEYQKEDSQQANPCRNFVL